MRQVLGLESGKTKEDTARIILQFLMDPYDHERKVPKGKAGSSSKLLLLFTSEERIGGFYDRISYIYDNMTII